MSGDQVRCACCGDVASVDEAAGWQVWLPMEWDLPAVLSPRRQASQAVRHDARERTRRRRVMAKRSKRAARRG